MFILLKIKYQIFLVKIINFTDSTENGSNRDNNKMIINISIHFLFYYFENNNWTNVYEPNIKI